MTFVNSQSIITDRQDQRESAIIVEPGILQIESVIINQVDGYGVNRLRNLIIPTNPIRNSISNLVELRLVLNLYGTKKRKIIFSNLCNQEKINVFWYQKPN